MLVLDLRRRLKLYFPSDGHRIVNNRNRYSVVFEHCLCLVQSEYLREKHSEKKSETKKGVAASEKSNSSFLNNLSKKTLKRCSRRCLLRVEQLLSKSNKQQPMDVLSFATCCLQPDLRSVINDTVFFPIISIAWLSTLCKWPSCILANGICAANRSSNKQYFHNFAFAERIMVAYANLRSAVNACLFIYLLVCCSISSICQAVKLGLRNC